MLRYPRWMILLVRRATRKKYRREMDTPPLSAHPSSPPHHGHLDGHFRDAAFEPELIDLPFAGLSIEQPFSWHRPRWDGGWTVWGWTEVNFPAKHGSEPLSQRCHVNPWTHFKSQFLIHLSLHKRNDENDRGTVFVPTTSEKCRWKWK